MRFPQIFSRQPESDDEIIAGAARVPNNSEHTDEELIASFTRDAVGSTSATANTRVSIDTSAIEGPEQIANILSKRILEYINMSGMLSAILQLDLRQGYGDKGILEFIGLNREVAVKYLQAIFGSFGNPQYNTTDGTKNLLRSTPFIDALYYDVMELTDNSAQHIIRQRGDELSATMAKLRKIRDLKPDLESANELIIKIQEEESQRDPSNRRLSYEEVMELAETTFNRTKPLDQKDLHELNEAIDRVIADNASRAQTVIRPATQSPTSRPAASPVLDLAAFERDAEPQLAAAIKRLSDLYDIFKGTDDDLKFKIEEAINGTQVAQGNLMGTVFNTPTYTDVIRLIVNLLKIANNKQLGMKILEIDNEFQAKGIYQIN